MSKEPHDIMLALIHEAAMSRKAGSPVALDLRPLTPFTDYFYLCTSQSRPQSEAILEAVLEKLDGAGFENHHVEGAESADWILVDAGDVVAHIFLGQDRREFFSLERLWADAERVPLPADEPEAAAEGSTEGEGEAS